MEWPAAIPAKMCPVNKVMATVEIPMLSDSRYNFDFIVAHIYLYYPNLFGK